MLIFKIFFLKVSVIGLRRIENVSKKIATGLVFLFISFILIFLGRRALFTKSDFYKGFNNKEIKNQGDLCHFFKIGVNWYGAFDHFFWDFAHQKSECSKREIDLEFIKNQ